MSKCKESELIYGASGAGKTTQAQELARWVRQEMGPGMITRIVSASGGGWSSIEPAVNKGLVIPTFICDRRYAVETVDKMTQGWWPQDPQDPASPLIPPEKQKEWEGVGAIVFDSMTEIADWMQSKLIAREAKGEIKVSQLSVKFRDGDTDYGLPALAHYGNIQQRIKDLVSQSKSIPGRYIVWTALELKATDDNSRLPLYGPDVIGKAKTASASAWFDNTLHLYLTGAGGMKKGNVVRRLYFNTHFEDDGVPFVAKNRGHFYAPISGLNGGNDFLEGPKCSLYEFLMLLKKSQEAAEAKLTAEIESSKPTR